MFNKKRKKKVKVLLKRRSGGNTFKETIMCPYSVKGEKQLQKNLAKANRKDVIVLRILGETYNA